ncbi:DUF4960 domain-containing protein [Chitinophaga sp.]|uniref:DUF4960 domain-containing protein n=1 Tax=Chitinophaga sp. TaxID=1869181 RepID=UPI0031E14E80
MKRILSYIIALLLLSSCEKNNGGIALDLSGNIAITSFSVNGAKGTIDTAKGTIDITLPFGTDLTKVAPVIDLPTGATVTPASGATVNMKNAVRFRVINGNIYKDYTATASEETVIHAFVVKGVNAEIDNTARTIKATVPSGTDLTVLTPGIQLVTGATATPDSGQVVDFTDPVIYKITKGQVTIDYTVTITSPVKVAFLSTAATANDIADPDEKAAWTWLINDNPEAQFMSFASIKNHSADLSTYGAIWWHEDNTQDLPAIAFDAAVISALKTYYANGGSFLLTAYGAKYVEGLGIVPAGKAPNNSFGDPAGKQWLEPNWAWGISFKGHEDHPAFAGLTLTPDKPYATAYTLSNGTYRLNHTAQWYIPDWGGYGTIANWRAQTGGIDLGSTEWDGDHNTVVTMAEFPRTAEHGKAITISSGCYDWYSEADPANAANQPVNSYLPNVKKMTANVLKYLNK